MLRLALATVDEADTDKVRTVIDRDDRPSLAEIVQQLNPIVRGWGNYFGRLNSSRHFWKVDLYVCYKLCRWLRRKHQRVGRAIGSTPPTFFVKAGLHTMHGTVAYGTLNAAGEGSRRAV